MFHYAKRKNFASSDCGAIVLSANDECQKPSQILKASRDTCLLNRCELKRKFVDIQLADEICIDGVQMANFEKFSSNFADWSLFYSFSSLPPVDEDWVLIQRFTAADKPELQTFAVKTNEDIFTRYIRIEFNTHYGDSYYCPVSVVKVFGRTMMEDFRHTTTVTEGEFDNIFKLINERLIRIEIDVESLKVTQNEIREEFLNFTSNAMVCGVAFILLSLILINMK